MINIPWWYQLQGDLTKVPKSADFVVIDIDEDPKKVAREGRAVYAYLSIGEAEDYRSYWKRLGHRSLSHPVLLKENPDWAGNWAVRFWDEGWQSIILDCVKDAKEKGFQGLYLDKADVVEDIIEKGLLPKREASERLLENDMVRFIGRIALEAAPIGLCLQNAEFLLDHPTIRACITHYAKEDLYFGGQETGKPNSGISIAYSLKQYAQRPKDAQLFVVEYLNDQRKAQDVALRARAAGAHMLVRPEDRSLG